MRARGSAHQKSLLRMKGEKTSLITEMKSMVDSYTVYSRTGMFALNLPSFFYNRRINLAFNLSKKLADKIHMHLSCLVA